MEDILAARVKELVEENERLKEKNEVYIETIFQLKEEKRQLQEQNRAMREVLKEHEQGYKVAT